MALTPSQRMGLPPRNLPTGQARGLKAHVDAHGCIRSGLLQTTEYKSVDAMFRVHWQVPLGSSWET